VRCTPCSGRSGLGHPGGGMGEVGFLQRLRGKVAPVVCHQRGAHLLRAHRLQNVAEMRLREELLAETNLAGTIFLAASSSGTSPTEALGHALAECGISVVRERADHHGQTQRIEIALSSLKRASGWMGRWRRRWWGSRAGSRRRSASLLPASRRSLDDTRARRGGRRRRRC
jgi:hypothetical protein